MPTGLFTLTQVNQAIRQGAWTGYIAPTWVEYLVVAGGGGGGANNGGGGGSGGLLTGVVSIAAGTSYTVTVGAGGGDTSNGQNSVFGVITAIGGGAGAPGISGSGSAGGSGGGGTFAGPSGQGVFGQGNAGGAGDGISTNSIQGGGGGAGTAGVKGVYAALKSGDGGAGIASAISGVPTVYAGGGGSSSSATSTGGAGGVGGGASGYSGPDFPIAGGSGSSNTGGGGGGGSRGGGAGGSGGSGIVIVRYPGTVQFFTGGTLSYANGYVIHTFYTSGTLAPTTPTPYVAAGYQIGRSLRFNSADSAYLNRTPASAGNRRIWTWSGWVKRQNSAIQTLFNAYDGTSSFACSIYFFNDALQAQYGGSAINAVLSPAVYRDYSAWYHIVWTVNATAGTQTQTLYVNGVQVATASTPNADAQINSTISHTISAASNAFSGYMTEVNFIDGQALTPSSFGITSPDTGVWQPKPYAGTYGTNGFYLNFSDNSNTTATTLGKDYSGNGNNWTPNNFSVSAGAGNDSLVDVPTNWGTDTGVGGTVRGNYATLNPLAKGASASLANGNLDYSVPSASNDPCVTSTIGMSSGKWYAEFTVVSSSEVVVGISNTPTSLGLYVGSNTTSWGYYGANGNKVNSASSVAYGATFTTNDVIGVAFDADAGTLTFYKNGVSQGTAYSGLPANTYYFATGNNNTGAGVYSNFGQRPFAYTAPLGFKALCTQNLPTTTIGATTATQAGKYFNAVTYTGNGSSRSITGLGFQPDFTWIKDRSAGFYHRLADAVRGVGKELYSNDTGAETTNSVNGYVTSFDSDGFSLGTGIGVNQNGTTYVAWNWKANGAGMTNTAGSITSTVSANTTSGFSVVTWTCPAGASDVYTVGHGLGAAPKMIIIKSRNGAYNWFTWHIGLGDNTTDYVALNLTNAEASSAGTWGAVGRNSTVMGFTNGVSTIANNTMVAYVFSEVPGFSKFGSYVGNGSTDGTFVYTGFRPAYLLIKRTDTTGDWIIWDVKRNTYNALNSILYPNLSNAEATAASVNIDFLSNGFKLRASSSSLSSGTFVFAAFAEFPFKFALAR